MEFSPKSRGTQHQIPEPTATEHQRGREKFPPPFPALPPFPPGAGSEQTRNSSGMGSAFPWLPGNLCCSLPEHHDLGNPAWIPQFPPGLTKPDNRQNNPPQKTAPGMFFQAENFSFLSAQTLLSRWMGNAWMWEPLGGVGLVWKITELCSSRSSGQPESNLNVFFLMDGMSSPCFPLGFHGSGEFPAGFPAKGSTAFPNGFIAKLFQLEDPRLVWVGKT